MKQDAPSAHRNREPILAVLREELPTSGRVLEIASGTGQHAVWFAAALPSLEWQPTDADPAALASIAAWREEAGLPNVRAPVRLDVREPWPDAAIGPIDAIVCINMIHTSPWAAAVALLEGAARIMPRGGPLAVYGAWRVDGWTEPSNEAFERDFLRVRDPSWGLKDVKDVLAEGGRVGLGQSRVVEMPAHNRIVILRSA
jgi:SAM-dependent methyltransferase